MTNIQRGTLTISLDFELAWGVQDSSGTASVSDACLLLRETVLDELLALFAEFNVSATWCTVGKLFLEGEENDPLFYGQSLIEKVRNCPVKQEIGSHSWGHEMIDDLDVQSLIVNLQSCQEAAQNNLRSFAFPRNRVAHLDKLVEHGFTSYRGRDPYWFEQEGRGRKLSAVFRALNHVALIEPATILPVQDECGIWNIAGSLPFHSQRNLIPHSFRVKRALKGIDAAVRDQRIFHLWLHPFNLAEDHPKMIKGLRDVLEHAQPFVEANQLDILNMSKIVEQVSSLPTPHSVIH